VANQSHVTMVQPNYHYDPTKYAGDIACIIKNIKSTKEDEEYQKLLNAISDLKLNKVPTFNDKKDIKPEIKSYTPDKKSEPHPSKDEKVNKIIKPIQEVIQIPDPNKISEPTKITKSTDQAFKPLKSPLILTSYFPKVNSGIKVPIKYRSPEYFKVIQSFKKTLQTSEKELIQNNISKSLKNMEDLLYYLSKIE